MYCRNCGSEMDNNAAVCVKCGVAVGNGTSYCPNCGQATMPGAAACTGCGSLLGQPIPVGQQKSKIAAGLFGIFFGGLGVHNFYLGNTGRGLIQVLVSVLTCFLVYPVMQIWGMIEGILILAGSIDKDARGIPLKD